MEHAVGEEQGRRQVYHQADQARLFETVLLSPVLLSHIVVPFLSDFLVTPH